MAKMQYTLINANGKIRTFFILAVAELYQQIEGGVIVTPGTLEQTVQQTQTEPA